MSGLPLGWLPFLWDTGFYHAQSPLWQKRALHRAVVMRRKAALHSLCPITVCSSSHYVMERNRQPPSKYLFSARVGCCCMLFTTATSVYVLAFSIHLVYFLTFLEFSNLQNSLAQALRWFPISEPIFSAWISNHSSTVLSADFMFRLNSCIHCEPIHTLHQLGYPAILISHPCHTKYLGFSLLFTLCHIFSKLNYVFSILCLSCGTYGHKL